MPVFGTMDGNARSASTVAPLPYAGAEVEKRQNRPRKPAAGALELLFKLLARPVLDRLDSETMHVLTCEALHLAEGKPISLRLLECLGPGGRRFQDPRLAVDLAGIKLENPLLVAAGWDKKGRAVRGLWALGFAGVEVGSVVRLPQPGNPRPRQFVLHSTVAINRLGFNSPGMEAVARNLRRYRLDSIPIGISIGKNRTTQAADAAGEHAAVAFRLYDRASYFCVNVSSPNTPGLRKLQEKQPLTDILQAVLGAMDERGHRKPLFVKVDPDMPTAALEDVIDVAVNERIAGIVATNTTTNEQIKARYGERWRQEPGGLSGDDEQYRRLANAAIAHIRTYAPPEMLIIGVGGVKDTGTALEKMLAGANAVQVLTALRGEGPGVAGAIAHGMAAWMDRHAISNISGIVGADSSRFL